jgi:hypothetical protein
MTLPVQPKPQNGCRKCDCRDEFCVAQRHCRILPGNRCATNGRSQAWGRAA